MEYGHQYPYYYLSITMAFGSFIAGSTSEGGGSVAFPVMTFLFGIPALIARDFSLMIQSFGMTAASITIFLLGIKVVWRAILYISLGGFLGVFLGVFYVFPALPNPYPKMIFVSIWLPFAYCLYLINTIKNRPVYNKIPAWERGVFWERTFKVRLGLSNSKEKNEQEQKSITTMVSIGNDLQNNELENNEAHEEMNITISLNHKAISLFITGVIGGIFTAISGSGICICSFAVLVLYFRVSEKTATPTSIILMSINTVLGFIAIFLNHVIDTGAWKSLYVCIPICTIGAPLGAIFSAYWHRMVHACIVYAVEIVQFVGACALIQPWTTKKTNNPFLLCFIMLLLIISGLLTFTSLKRNGERLLRSIPEEELNDSKATMSNEMFSSKKEKGSSENNLEI